jgi:hypothetical protein
MNATFERRRHMSKDEAKVFYMAEDLVREQRLAWRVTAQVSLGEVLSSARAWLRLGNSTTYG